MLLLNLCAIFADFDKFCFLSATLNYGTVMANVCKFIGLLSALHKKFIGVMLLIRLKDTI